MIHKSNNLTFISRNQIMIDSMHFDPHIYGRKVFSSSSVQNFCLIFLFLKITRKNEILKPNHTNSTKSLAVIIFFCRYGCTVTHVSYFADIPHTARCRLQQRFSRSILVSPMRSSIPTKSQSQIWTVSSDSIGKVLSISTHLKLHLDWKFYEIICHDVQ